MDWELIWKGGTFLFIIFVFLLVILVVDE